MTQTKEDTEMTNPSRIPAFFDSIVRIQEEHSQRVTVILSKNPLLDTLEASLEAWTEMVDDRVAKIA